jgi:hypothetical protein
MHQNKSLWKIGSRFARTKKGADYTWKAPKMMPKHHFVAKQFYISVPHSRAAEQNPTPQSRNHHT